MRTSLPIVAMISLAAATGAQEIQPRVQTVAQLGDAHVDRVFDSPNGRYLIIDAGDEIRIQRRDGSIAGTISGLPRTQWTQRAPSVSRARDRVVFVRHDDQAKSNFIWIAAIDTSNGSLIGEPRRISIRRGDLPSISPDGRTITYVRREQEKTSLVAIPASGGDERKLATVDGSIERQETSPDGKWVYFEHQQPSLTNFFNTIERVPSAGGALEVVAHASWFLGISGDGNTLAAYAQGSSPWAGFHPPVAFYDVNGKEVGRWVLPLGLEVHTWSAALPGRLIGVVSSTPRVLRSVALAGGPVRELPSTRFGYNPHFTLDGRKLVAQHEVNGRQEFMIADSDGAGWRPLPTREEPADAQNTALEVIAPDGHHIAFRSHDRQRLNVLDLSSGETRTLVADTTGLIRHAWLSDGRAILYQTRANPSSALDVRRVALDGRDSLIRRFSRFARPDPEDTRLHFINDTLAAALTRTTVALVSLRSGTVDTVFQAPYINHGTGSSPLVVSPDGKWFGFTAGARWGDTVHAHMISIDGKQHRAIAQIGCWTRIRAFHPNGHDVIALGIVDCDTPQRSEKLYLVPLNGDPMRPLTGAEDARSISGVTLSPDGNRIVFDSDRPQRKSVVQIDLPALVRK